MDALPDYDAAYRENQVHEGQAGIPWNLGEPQPALRAVIDSGRVRGPVLDAGCGIGATTRYLAEQGFGAVGLDSSETAIERARAHAAGTSAEFAVADITRFTGYDGRFRTVLDSTLLHSLPVAARDGYLRSIARAAAPGAGLHVLVFSAEARFPDDGGPNAVTEDELREVVGRHWAVDEIAPSVITTLFAPVEADNVGRDEQGRAQLPAFLLSGHLPG
jgi:SAM-dependent methyltransferase